MIPFQVTLIPVYQLVAKLGLMNTFPGLIIPRATNAFGIFFLRQFFLGIPRTWTRPRGSTAPASGGSTGRIVMPLARRRCSRSACSTSCSTGTTCCGR